MWRLVAFLFLSVALVSSASSPLERRRDLESRNPKRFHAKLTPPQNFTERAPADYLLPTNVIPVSYDLTIYPYVESPPERIFTFDGVVVTRVNIQATTNQVVMHAWDLTISSVVVKRVSDGGIIGVRGWDIGFDDRQFLTIFLDSSLLAGQEYDFNIVYMGIINDELYGLYRYNYQDEQGFTRWVAVTDLQATGSRRVVPWFDQPNLKAPITLHVAREPNRIITSNMPILSDGDPVVGLEGWVWVHFVSTPPISTYLFCFASHTYASNINPVDTRIQLLARSQIIGDTQYFVDASAPILQFFETYTGIPYQLPKLDQMALIEFGWGGMENWGLVTYREPYTRYNPLVDTVWDKQSVANLISHEIAHQWFGDLVSPKWWSNTWLNEGFATYFEYIATTSVGVDWNLEEQFVLDMMYSAFKSDASVTTHPMNTEVDSPASIEAIFDSISYNKGGCIVRFMVHLFGEQNFQTAISNYLTIMSYKAAEQDDLFNLLTPFAPTLPSGVTLTQLMATWVNQAGFPLVTVTRNYDTRTATLTQERFGHGGPERWVIPVTMTNSGSPDFNTLTPQAWLLADGQPITIKDPIVPGNLQWIILNLKQTGFYRVNYDEDNWSLIAAYLSTPGVTDNINVINRGQLIDDALHLARVGRLNYHVALRTTDYLDKEFALMPWLTAVDNLAFIRDRIYQTTEGVQIFQSYMRNKLTPVYESVNGFGVSVDDAHWKLLLRWEITRWACNMELSTCNAEGVNLFRQWQQIPDPDVTNPIPVDLRTPAYCAGQRLGGRADYDFLLARYRNNLNSDMELQRILIAIGCSTDVTILQDILNKSLDPDIINYGGARDILSAVSANPIGIDIALDFLIQNWLKLNPLLGNIGRGFIAISDNLNTQEHYNKISKFRSDNAFNSDMGLTSLSQITTTLNDLEMTLEWNFANLNVVMDYFRQSRQASNM